MRIALILAGGFGTRLAPITKTLNKSLVPIDGKPALARIISQIDELNLDKIIVLAGYLSWQVDSLVQSLSNSFKSEVRVSITPSSFSSAERLLDVSEVWRKASEVFLIYCDNVISQEDFLTYISDVSSQKVIVQKRSPGNIDLKNSGSVNYSLYRSDTNEYVELGYWFLNSRVFFDCLSSHGNLQEALQELTANEKVHAIEINSYDTLSDLGRYVSQRSRNRRTVFLDRDGVLVKSLAKGKYLKKIEQVEFIFEHIQFFRELSLNYSIDFIVVTNQAGVERNLLSQEEVDAINQYISLKLLSIGVPVIAFYVCPHHWDSNCQCRKPKPGLVNRAIHDFSLNPANCLLIGDRESDILAGESAGVKSYLVTDIMNPLQRAEVFKSIIGFFEKT